MDLLYIGDSSEEVDAAVKCVEDAFPGVFELEDDWDYIHEYRVSVKPKQPPEDEASLKRAYVKHIIKSGYGPLSLMVQMNTMDREGVAFLKPILDEIKAEKAV